VLVLVAALMSVLVACGGGDAGESSDEGRVVFGVNTQLSGSLQVYGLPAAQGVEAAVEDINAAGGVKVGDKTYEMVLAEEDNRTDPSAVVSAARAVADAGAIAALGPDISGRAAYNVWKRAGVITFTPSFDLQLELMENAADNPLLFSATPFLAELFQTNMAQVTAELPDIKRVAIIAPAHEEGQGSAAAYAAAAKHAGLTVVGNETYPANATDYTSILTGFKADKPDLLIALQSAEQATTILQHANQLGVARYGLNDVLTPDQVLEAKGLGSMTVIIPNFSPTFSPSATIPAYKPDVLFGGEEPAGNPGAAVDMYYSVFMVKQAMEDAGTVTDAEAIAKELPGQSYDGPFGTCQLSERREMDCETLLDVVKGDEITVYRFPNPDSVEETDTYTCRGGECQAK
jgi:branched-chain amino acid transport system substrate-binding protein